MVGVVFNKNFYNVGSLEKWTMSQNEKKTPFKTHYRRCHICDELVCAEQRIVKTCTGCRQHLSAMHFYDEEVAMGLVEPYEAMLEKLNAPTSILPLKEYPPLVGFCSYWE